MDRQFSSYMHCLCEGKVLCILYHKWKAKMCIKESMYVSYGSYMYELMC